MAGRGGILTREHKIRGLLMTNVLSKGIYLVEGRTLTGLSLERGEQVETETKTEYPWLKVRTSRTDTLVMNWNIWKHRTPAEVVLNTVADLKTHFLFKDFLIKKIEVGMDDRILVGMMNDFVKKWQEGEGQIKKSNPLPLDTRVYTKYVHQPLPYNTDDKLSRNLHKINLSSIKKFHFPDGVLELKHLATERKKKYGEREDIDFLLTDKDIVKRILLNIRTEKWDKYPEVIAIQDEKGRHPAPAVVRTEEKKRSNQWVFKKDEEVRSP